MHKTELESQEGKIPAGSNRENEPLQWQKKETGDFCDNFIQ